MIIYEGRFNIGTFVKHKISKEIFIVKAIILKDKTGINTRFQVSNGLILQDTIEEELEIATDIEIEEANRFLEEG